MKIAPISMADVNRFGRANNNYSHNTSFKGNDKERSIYAPVTFIASLSTIIGAMYGIKVGEMNYQQKLGKTAQTLSQSPDIVKDTFTVKDVNDDETPDLILYKKDGSKVAIDMTTGEMLEETNDIEIIE